MSKIEQNTVFLDQLAEMFSDYEPAKWRLTRSDGLTKESADIKWLEFNDDSTFKEDHKHEFAVGRSLLMSPFNAFFTWQTTPVTEIISSDSNTLVFKTKNSTYTLTAIENESK